MKIKTFSYRALPPGGNRLHRLAQMITPPIILGKPVAGLRPANANGALRSTPRNSSRPTASAHCKLPATIAAPGKRSRSLARYNYPAALFNY